jgi:hypothetical protein
MGCPYKYALGIPGQGFHSTRIYGYALYDILATIVLAFVTSYLTKQPFLPTLVFWLILGEILHYVFGTQTAFLTSIGIKVQCDDEN